MRTYIEAYMSLNFGQISPLSTELAALERLKNRCHHIISVDIDPIFFKLAGNKNMHNIMKEFEFRPDRTTDYGVSYPWASKKYPHRLIMGKMVFPSVRPHFQTWISPRPAGWLQSNFIWSIIGVGERLQRSDQYLHVLVQIRSELWFPWQWIAPMGL